MSDHLQRLAPADQRSRAIVEQMKIDEAEHADMAIGLGGRKLPLPARLAMRMASKVMTSVAYRV